MSNRRQPVSLDTKSPSSDSDPSGLERNISNIAGSVADIDLAVLGLEPEAHRDISTLEIVAAGWNICNSWGAMGATMALSIASGGSVTLIYGILIIFVLVGSSAASLAEIASVYPTAGGQYHWTSILSPKKYSRGLSYCCGAANIFGWISNGAGFCIIPPQLIAGIIAFYNPNYTPTAWHIFVMFQASNIIWLCYNIFLIKRTNWIHDLGFVFSIAGFFVTLITCLARTSEFQSNEFVWKTFVNNSGWSSDGIVFLTGLTNPNYIYSGIDGAIHLAEECKDAAKTVPKALMSTIFIGFVTSFIFAVAMLYCIADFDAVLATSTGVPLYEIWHQATRSETAATVFIMILAGCGFFAMIGCQQTASRLTWSFARDDAIVGSHWLGQIHPRHGVPVWSLLANSAIVFIIGCIYLGSTTAFNAMISTGLILQQISYAMPTALLMYRGRSTKFLPSSRSFKLGPFGWVANSFTVIMAFIAIIFYNFPTVMPVTGSNMNYASAVLGTMGLFTIGNWFGYAKKRYEGPRIPDEVLYTS